MNIVKYRILKKNRYNEITLWDNCGEVWTSRRLSGPESNVLESRLRQIPDMIKLPDVLNEM